ncbi:MAG: MFS transporter [Ilumatobacteraceae bacterium]|nr:MFS transporter [Ilumatobacteraceae bacterium]
MSSEPVTQRGYSAVDRRALGSVATQFFVNGAAFASFVPRLPEIRERVGVGLDGLGLIMTLAITIGTVGSLQAPRLIERFGTRWTLVVGGVLLTSALPTIGFATAPVVFVFGAAAMFVADGLVDVSMNLQGSWLSARRHAPVMNRLHGLWSLGTVVGGLVAAQAAASGVSLQTHLTVAAALMLASLTFVGRGLLTVDEGQTDRDADADAEAPSPKRTGAARSALIVLAVSGAFSVTVELVSGDWAAFRLSEDFGATAGFAGLGYVAFTVGMTAGRLGGDAVVMRIGDARLLRWAIVVSGLGLAGAAFVPNRWAVLAAYGVAGIGTSTFFPKLYDDAARFRGRRGTGLAWLRTGSSVTALMIPTLVGVLAATSLSVGAATAIVTLPCVAGLLALSLRR